MIEINIRSQYIAKKKERNRWRIGVKWESLTHPHGRERVAKSPFYNFGSKRQFSSSDLAETFHKIRTPLDVDILKKKIFEIGWETGETWQNPSHRVGRSGSAILDFDLIVTHWTIRHSQRWHTENTPLGSRMKWRMESTSGLVPSKTLLSI